MIPNRLPASGLMPTGDIIDGKISALGGSSAVHNDKSNRSHNSGFYSMMIVDADDCTGEGEDLAEGGEDGGVDDSCWRHNEGGDEEKDTEEH